MSDKRRGLGRGLGALIPSAPAQRPGGERPVDVFFPERDGGFTGNIDATPVSTDADEETSTGDTGDGVAGDVTTAQDGAGSDPIRPADPVGRTESTDSPAADDLIPVPGATFAEIPIEQIVPNPRQPRQVFDPEALAELVHSIREIGVLQPVVVRRVELPADPSAETDDDTAAHGGRDGSSRAQPDAVRYELVMGERRWRASQQAGLERIPAIVRDTQDDALLRDALLENLHRSDLNPLEEAAAYQQLLDDFGCTHDDLAQRIGRSRPQISNTLRLMKLPPLVQRRVAAGVLSAGHARALLGLADGAAMERLAQRIVAEGLSVRSTEEVVAVGEAGDDATPARRAARPGERHAALDELASRLSDRFDTRVKIALGQRKGKLTVEFATVEDLNRILGVLAPEEPGVFRG